MKEELISKKGSINGDIPEKIIDILSRRGFKCLRPCQSKAINAGLFKGNNLLVCTPTASGKTLVGELAALNAVLEGGKAVYVVPLRALANEKYKQFRKDYPGLKIGLSSGDIDSSEDHLGNYDVIIATSEKLDSLLRHKVKWITFVKAVVIDEIHLINDPSRGPTLEVVITMLRELINPQIIGLSATIGNPKDLADWLNSELVLDDWRPVELKKGVIIKNKVKFKT